MPHGHFSDFIALCILHYQALIGKLLKFLQVYSGSYKNLDNDFTGCWLVCEGSCIMERQYIVKMIRNASDWLFYAGGALIIKVFSRHLPKYKQFFSVLSIVINKLIGQKLF